jgi:heterotetrameric sarcosine oxidase delta subunit
MSFQLNCPNCGKRAVSEFSFKCEYMERPEADADFKEWGDYIFLRENKKRDTDRMVVSSERMPKLVSGGA